MYFNRVWIKENSKARLHGNDRWNASAVTLIEMLILSGVTSILSFSFIFSMLPSFYILDQMDMNDPTVFFSTFFTSYLGTMGILLIFTLFVGGILQVGCMGWFMRFTRGESPAVGTLFNGFKMYGKSLGTVLLTNLYVFLWSLLFFIPGIVKGYSYMLAPYLICDNPHLTPSQAIALSKKLTAGYKWDLFVMQLSFFGWLYLAALTPFSILGYIYVFPYYYTSLAGSYLSLKQMALMEGRLSPADFGETEPVYTPGV
ncbi:MAG: DUF975 family protein [Clostridia bacterium]|nr:DUF975 family protein [Clostridia bacterium]